MEFPKTSRIGDRREILAHDGTLLDWCSDFKGEGGEGCRTKESDGIFVG